MTRAPLTLLLLALLALLAVPAAAQRPAPPGQQRDQLEARFRQVFARVVRERVGLSDDQMRRLGPINERFATERRRLQMEERTARMVVQRALRTPETADSAEVGRMLDRMLDVQKQRVELAQAEQRELATVMSPIQRARYMALQEQVRREVEDRAGRGPPGRRGPPPF